MCTVIAGMALSSMMSYGTATAVGMSAAATTAATVLGAAAGAQAGADVEAAKYNEDVANLNAKTLETEAEQTRSAGSQEAQKKAIQTKQQTSRAATQMAASGLDISSGTPLDLLAQSEEIGTIDSMTILNNANRQAFGYEGEAQNLRTQAKMDTKRAKNKFGTTILGTAGRIGSMGMV